MCVCVNPSIENYEYVYTPILGIRGVKEAFVEGVGGDMPNRSIPLKKIENLLLLLLYCSCCDVVN